MRLAVRAAVLGLALLVLASDQAAAESSLIPISLKVRPPLHREDLSGPAVVGNRVIWGHRVKDHYLVVTQRGRDASVRRIAIPGLKRALQIYFHSRLEASEQHVLLGLSAATCVTRAECRHYRSSLVYAAVFTGVPGGRLSVLAGCTDRKACKAPGACAGAGDVSGAVISYGTCDGVVHVRDLTLGATPSGRDFTEPKTGPVRVAGSYIAMSPDENTTMVSNWRTGDVVYSVPTDGSTYDLQADGKLAYQRYVDNSREADRASPAEPFAHKVSSDIWYSIQIAGDRLAVGQPTAEGPGSDTHVVGLDGSEVSEAYDAGALTDMLFDGSRLSWISQPCVNTWLVVGDLNASWAGRPLPDARCEFPTIAHRSARILGAKHRLRVRLDCPAKPEAGCAGTAQVVGSVPRRYEIAAGKSLSLGLRTGRRPCRLGRHRVRALLRFFLPKVSRDPAPRMDKTIVARGDTTGIARCPGPHKVT